MTWISIKEKSDMVHYTLHISNLCGRIGSQSSVIKDVTCPECLSQAAAEFKMAFDKATREAARFQKLEQKAVARLAEVSR